MPPRLNLFTARAVAFRPKPTVPQKRLAPTPQLRFASNDPARDLPESSTQKGPNTDQLPHVSEEQAAIDETMGETPPDLERGTPVQEVMDRDPEAQKHMPQVLKDQMKNGQKRSFSTSARRRLEQVNTDPPAADALPLSMTEATQQDLLQMQYPDGGFGHKFPLPDAQSIPRTDHLKRRYDPVVDQVTKSIMRHGKLSQAQKNMSIILDTLRTASPPQPNAQFPSRTLIISQPRDTLPLDPIGYLTAAVDSVAPLIKIRQQRGVAGGGASLPIPVPLGIRQRRRQAIQWILQSAGNRREIRLADRVAKEIIGVAEGRSSAWEKRQLVHKLGIASRSNVRQMAIMGSVRRRKIFGA